MEPTSSPASGNVRKRAYPVLTFAVTCVGLVVVWFARSTDPVQASTKDGGPARGWSAFSAPDRIELGTIPSKEGATADVAHTSPVDPGNASSALPTPESIRPLPPEETGVAGE